MKRSKIILGIVLIFVFVLLTGCSLGKEQTLFCKASTSGVDVGFNVGFKGIKITSMDITYDMDLQKYSDVQIEAINKQDFCASVKNSMKQYENAFNECTQSVADKHLHVATSLDVNKVAKSELDKLSTIENAKKGLEEVGYTCTIE